MKKLLAMTGVFMVAAWTLYATPIRLGSWNIRLATMDNWEKDGVRHQKLKVRASTIKFLSRGDRLAGGPRPQEPAAAAEPPEAEPTDIPF